MLRRLLVAIGVLAGTNLCGADGSNTQIIMSYTHAGSCSVVVSETNTFSSGILQNPVNDVNETMFPGSSADTRAGAGLSPSNSSIHFFVAGTRDAEWATDMAGSLGAWSNSTTYALNDMVTSGGHLYLSLQASNLNNTVSTTAFWKPMYVSRALHANTLHYWQANCSGTLIPGANLSNTDHTGNIPSDDTRGEPPDANPDGSSRIPTVPGTRNVDWYDPKTGVQLRNVYLTSDTGQNINLYDGARKHMCSNTLTGPTSGADAGKVGWLCSFGSDNGNADLYWVVRDTREVRWLGIQRGAVPGYPSCGGQVGNVSNPPDDVFPLVTIVATNYHVSGTCGTSGEVDASIMVKQTFNDATFTAANPGDNAHLQFDVMAAYPNSIPALLNGFNPNFDTSKFSSCSLESLGAQYAYTECRAGIQGTIAWVGVFDLGDRLPLGSCSNCLHVIALTEEWKENSQGTANYNHRWEGSHSGSLVGDGGLGFVVPGAFEGCTSGGASTTLSAAVTSTSATSITVTGPQGNVNAMKVGSLMSILEESTNTTEWVTIASTSGSGPTWTVNLSARGQLGSTASLHSAGAVINIFTCDPAIYPQFYLGPWSVRTTQDITTSTTSFTVDTSTPTSQSDSVLATTLMPAIAGDLCRICWGSTLSAAITSTTQTTLQLTSGTSLQNGWRLVLIGTSGATSEMVTVVSGGGTSTIVVTRGTMSSTPTLYTSGTAIRRFYNDCSGAQFRTITNITGTTWTIDSAFTSAWPSGTQLIMNIGHESDGHGRYWWWDFLNAPNGESTGYVPEENGDYYGQHGDWTSTNYVTESYHVRQGALFSEISQSSSLEISAGPTYNGKPGPTGGTSFSHYPVIDKANASATDKNWFVDLEGMIGGGFSADSTHPATLVPGTTQIYEYVFCTVALNNCGGSELVLHRRLIPTFAQSGRSVLTDVSGPGVTMVDGAPGNMTYCVPEKGSDCVTGSSLGKAYFNVTGMTDLNCKSSEGGSPGVVDICIGDISAHGNTLFQFSMIPSSTGYGRRLSSSESDRGYRIVKELAKSTPDGKQIFFRPQPTKMFMLTPPPFQTSKDSFDRTQYIPVDITLPYSGTTLPSGTATAEVDFGYDEDGGNCTSRQEPCVTVTAGSIPTVPFVFPSVDTYTRLACTSGCTPQVPAVANRVLRATAKYYNSAGTLLRSDVLPPVIVAPAAFTPGGSSASPSVSMSGVSMSGVLH